ncbi:hypothetical protein [Arthrobacter sp. FW306-06-A]|uniref:hypothetical protein n=1 Tax=Arthrobacter sp. FW306-06-A TaxID=2879621 RepID=UPI001F429DDC|nr:hypothetical protein [Arthrobacter sp. FW306-06-A]UKA69565.1 hypothetical protein LFT49_12355 [Arthrobacter sp. FW306-06-A]
MVLADLYDADQRTRNAEVRSAAGNFRIPHPLPRVKYADGTATSSAGREIRSPWINAKESE